MEPWSVSQLRELAALSGSAAMAFSFRSAQSLALLDLTRDQSMAVKMEDVGSLNAKGQLAYALGKLLGGPVVDACGGAKSLVAILVMLSGSFAAMARCQAAGAKLLGSFATARFATAAVWTSCAVALRSSFSQHGLAQALSLGQVAMRLGASFGSMLGGLLLSRLGSWRRLLMAYAGLGTATGLLLFLRLSMQASHDPTGPTQLFVCVELFGHGAPCESPCAGCSCCGFRGLLRLCGAQCWTQPGTTGGAGKGCNTTGSP